MMTAEEFNKVFKLPFDEASQLFKEKLNIPTEKWTDLWEGEQAKGFMSAGAMQADLLADLRKMVQKAIDGGMDIREFRKQFGPLVAKYGWQLKGGGPGWRADLIFRTNINSAYAAGRWQQFKEAGIKYLRYVHADGVMHPRPHHQAMHGTVRPIDDPFWSVNYPPQGFGCHCRAVPVTDKEYAATPDNQKQLPKGWENSADPGWGYNVGQEATKGYEALTRKFETLPVDIARAWMTQFVQQPQFEQFIAGRIKGNFPVAVLNEADKVALGTNAQVVWLSDDSLAKNKGLTDRSKGHPEITLDDYRLIPEIIDKGEVYKRSDLKLIYLNRNGKLYRLVLKRTNDGAENYFLSLLETTDEFAKRQVADRYEKVR